MRIAYLNARYKPGRASGGNAHVHQFVSCAVEARHEIWMDPAFKHPGARALPEGRLRRVRTLRNMDVFYTRVEWQPPPQARWQRLPYRLGLGQIPTVYEFNTAPEYGRLLGRSDEEVQRAIADFRAFARGCALAVCVTEELATYVREYLHIQRVVTIPNGSDPALFSPRAAPARRVRDLGEALHVVWMGSAHLAWHHLELLRKAAESIWQQGRGEQVVFHLLGENVRGMQNMPPNVHYYGAVPYEDLPRWLCQMDVGLVLYREGPSMMGSPLKLFDYLASGLVVVANEHPQVRAILSEIDQADLIIGQDDAPALAARLLDLCTRKAWVKEQGTRGRNLVKAKYNWKKLVGAVFRELETLSPASRRQRT